MKKGTRERDLCSSVAKPSPIPLVLRMSRFVQCILQTMLTILIKLSLRVCGASVDDPTISADAMFQVQLYCAIVDSSATADVIIKMTGPSPSVFERENVHALLAETVAEDVICDDSDNDDIVIVVTMFPDPDQVNHNDTDAVDYPSTDDDDDSCYDDTSATDNEDDDDASDRNADVLDPTDPWSILSDAVCYDQLETLPPDEFYDAMEVETQVTVCKGTEFAHPIDPPLISPIWFRPRPVHWLYRWVRFVLGLNGVLGNDCPFPRPSATIIYCVVFAVVAASLLF
jgi:hypothetical protein